MQGISPLLQSRAVYIALAVLIMAVMAVTVLLTLRTGGHVMASYYHGTPPAGAHVTSSSEMYYHG